MNKVHVFVRERTIGTIQSRKVYITFLPQWLLFLSWCSLPLNYSVTVECHYQRV